MDITFSRVCTAVCIILVQVTTLPTNNFIDVNTVIKTACAPYLNVINPLPESCNPRQNDTLNPLCILIVGYVIDLCHLKKFAGINHDAPNVCFMELPNPNNSMTENDAILNRLKDNNTCQSDCQKDMALCKRLFMLASLVTNTTIAYPNKTDQVYKHLNIKDSVGNSQSTNLKNPEPVNTSPRQSPPTNAKPPDSILVPLSSSQPEDKKKSSTVGKHENDHNQIKSEPAIENKELPKPINNNNEKNSLANETHKKLNKTDFVKTDDTSVNVIPSNPDEAPEVDKIPEPQLTVPVTNNEENKKPNDGFPQEDPLNDPAQTDDEDPDAHDGNLQPEDGENNDDLSIKEDEFKSSNLQPPQLKNDDLNIPISESNGPFQESPDSHFFAYFLFFTCITIVAYIAFHNKNKILALALEGRRGRNGRRRPNTASYHKLDTSLEAAMASNPSRGNVTHVIY